MDGQALGQRREMLEKHAERARVGIGNRRQGNYLRAFLGQNRNEVEIASGNSQNLTELGAAWATGRSAESALSAQWQARPASCGGALSEGFGYLLVELTISVL
jgi:hypothetical protein